MSVYRCENCDNYYDADIHGIEEHPMKKNVLVCVCERCYEKLLDYEIENAE